MSADVRESYAGYVVMRLNAFREHAGDTARVWDFPKLVAARRSMRVDEADAFKGPWRNVRPYVTTEFREWVEEYNAERLTFSEWQRARMEEQRAEKSRQRDYMESVEYFTDELVRWAELTRDRDALIVAARERGASFKELMAATGLSRMAIHNVIAADARAMANMMTDVEWASLQAMEVA